jgi:hypothetical protein
MHHRQIRTWLARSVTHSLEVSQPRQDLLNSSDRINLVKYQKRTVPEILVLLLVNIDVRNGTAAPIKFALAASGDCLWLRRVTLSGVPLVIIEATLKFTVYNYQSSCTYASIQTHSRERSRCPLSFSTLTESSGWDKLLLLDRGIVVWDCFASGEAEAKRGTTAMIVASEKYILIK